MSTIADQSAASAAILTDPGAIFVSMELSKSTWYAPREVLPRLPVTKLPDGP